MRRYSFHPGDTVVFDLAIPFEIEDVEAVQVTFRNQYAVAFEVTITSFKVEIVESEDGEIIAKKTRLGFTLNQAESLQFSENGIYKMQLNVYGPNGSRAASKEYDIYTLAQHAPVVRGVTTTVSNLDYNTLQNKPQVNDVDLVGNRVLPEDAITSQRIEDIISST